MDKRHLQVLTHWPRSYCTVLFLQIHPISRKWGERRREAGHMDRHAVSGVRGSGVMETAASEDTDTGIYLEIL